MQKNSQSLELEQLKLLLTIPVQLMQRVNDILTTQMFIMPALLGGGINR